MTENTTQNNKSPRPVDIVENLMKTKYRGLRESSFQDIEREIPTQNQNYSEVNNKETEIGGLIQEAYPMPNCQTLEIALTKCKKALT